jgi:hypothetical protein
MDLMGFSLRGDLLIVVVVVVTAESDLFTFCSADVDGLAFGSVVIGVSALKTSYVY